jgi:hypothetical protein
LGLLTPGVGIFQMVYSSSNIFTISVLADRDIMPDPEFYRQCIEESFDEHISVILGITASKPAVQRSVKAKQKPKKSAQVKTVAAKKKPLVKKTVKVKASLKKTKGRPRKVADKKA